MNSDNNQSKMKDQNMKTVTNKTLLGAGVAIAVAMATWLPGTARGQDATKPMPWMKAGEHMMMLNHINTPAQAEALTPGDSVAMVCTKCKSVVVQNVTTEKGHYKIVTAGEKHLCPGCGSTITVVGAGKGASTAVKHVCGKCGSSSVFCCATKPGSGATIGMEKETEKK